MVRGTTIFLKLALFVIGFTVLILFIFCLPYLANKTAELSPDYAYLKLPVLGGLYLTAIPFYLALIQAFKLLIYIDNNNAFSKLSVKALQSIKYCAFIISSLYVAGFVFLISQNALHPGVAIIGLIIIFASIIVAVFTIVLHTLLEAALHLKSENDLTV